MGLEDPLEEEMATHSSVLAWEIPWPEEPGRLHPWGHKDFHKTKQLSIGGRYSKKPLMVV